MSDGSGGAGSPLSAFMLCASSILKFLGKFSQRSLVALLLLISGYFTAPNYFLQCVNFVQHLKPSIEYTDDVL